MLSIQHHIKIWMNNTIRWYLIWEGHMNFSCIYRNVAITGNTSLLFILSHLNQLPHILGHKINRFGI